MCDSQFQNLVIFLRIAKILPTFKEAKVLPWRLPNFGEGNNFVFLTIKKTKLFPLPKFALSGEIVISFWARHRGYYMPARGYEFYLRVVNSISHSFAALIREISS